jgi:hypothetical protein
MEKSSAACRRQWESTITRRSIENEEQEKRAEFKI